VIGCFAVIRVPRARCPGVPDCLPVCVRQEVRALATKPGATIVWAVGYSGVSGSFNPLALQNP
jgi:hypothetical protein